MKIANDWLSMGSSDSVLLVLLAVVGKRDQDDGELHFKDLTGLTPAMGGTVRHLQDSHRTFIAPLSHSHAVRTRRTTLPVPSQR